MQQLDFWIAKRACQSPNKTALIQMETGESWTYKQLMQYVNGWSTWFSHQAFQKGDRIAVCMENTIHSFAIIFACRMNELIYVPLNTKLSNAELGAVLADCTPVQIICDQVHEARAKHLMPGRTVRVEQCKPAQQYTHEWQDQPTLPWLMIYTGGTTGKSKGVVLSDEAVTANAINTILSWGLNDQDCTLNFMPLFHTGGINALALPILLAGGTVVIGQKFDPELAIRALNDYRTTISLFVPTMYQLMTDTSYFKESPFPTVKVFLSGGAPCPKPIYDRFKKRGLLFKEGYGLTEAGPNNFVIDAEIAMIKQGAIGKGMLFNEVQIMNDAGEACAPNEVGELCLKGSHVFSNYWNNEEETVKAFRNGWLKTGDLAKRDEDGDYYIVGRKKEMIITGGENVYPQEVEQCLIAESDVDEVSVIGIPNDKWGECVVAFIVAKQPTEALAHTLKKVCKERLANYKVPKRFYFLSELPKTVVGKIDKKQLANYAITENGS